MRTPGTKLVWLMQFIVNNQKYFTYLSYRMELSHLHTQYNTNSRTYFVNVITNKHGPNILNKLFPTCGAHLRKMNITDDLEISYLKINNTTNVFFKMYEVEWACLLFHWKKLEKIKPRLNSEFQISTGSWNYVWNRCVNIYVHVIGMALIMFTPNTPLLHDIPSPTKHNEFCCI